MKSDCYLIPMVCLEHSVPWTDLILQYLIKCLTLWMSDCTNEISLDFLITG